MNNFFKTKFFIGLVAVFIVAMLIINVLFKMDLGIPFFQAEWSAGDALSYVASFMATLGTMILAFASFRSSEKSQDIANQLSKENNELQRILAQNLYPTINVRDVNVYERTNDENVDILKKPVSIVPNSFCPAYHYDEPEGSIGVYINVDVDKDADSSSMKMMEFVLENTSQVLIRHIAFNRLQLNGFKGSFESVICRIIHNPKSGESLLLSPQQKVFVIVKLFYNDLQYERAWEDHIKGLSITFYVTNTSITGVQFSQYIRVDCNNQGMNRVFLGDKIEE